MAGEALLAGGTPPVFSSIAAPPAPAALRPSFGSGDASPRPYRQASRALGPSTLQPYPLCVHSTCASPPAVPLPIVPSEPTRPHLRRCPPLWNCRLQGGGIRRDSPD